ncbi:MAG: hypothetical protein ABIQ07_02435 [Ginsengibacter sp.]
MEPITKIQLSPQETELVANTEWILAKQGIIKKVYAMFGYVNELIKTEAAPFNYLFPGNIKNQNGKISKGENYKQLPYVILDYPAFFERENIFAIRTMFWWGNFFSVTLHLSGIFKEELDNKNPVIFSFLQKNNFFICINKNEWEHHFEEDNYKHTSAITLQQFEKINQKDFLKISKKIALQQWNETNDFVINSFREIMQLLQISYQGDKKDLLPGSPKVGSGL